MVCGFASKIGLPRNSYPIDNPKTCVFLRKDKNLQFSDFTIGVNYDSTIGVFVSTVV